VSEVGDINILRLALGGKHATAAIRDLWEVRRHDAPPSTLIKLCVEVTENPELQWAAERIVLHYAAKLAIGDTVDSRMRELVVDYYERKRRGKPRGRPTNSVKEAAVQWEVIEQSIRRPGDQRKSIIPDVAKKYGLKTRQVYKLIRHLPIGEILSRKK
jgi:hypothetical protein